ncbi:MAG: polysaccharide pyruvyl transferase family protein [Termitinemataceae bacterium]|nr:MAG: polysaccharide pyruvyl transferase family protein [Termitinemataceae bacterium]
MKKAGIITVHFFENFGSCLQAYALKTAIEKNCGVAADVINYIPALPQYKYFAEPRLLENYGKKKSLFKSFCKNQTGILSKPLSKKELADTNYDFYITGSDQVWNMDITKGDTAYFLDFVTNKPKIAYAASMALESNDEKIDTRLFEKYIPSFNNISVREKTHEHFIQQFTKIPVKTVLDPTFLLTSLQYNCLIENNKSEQTIKPPKEPYLLFFFLTHDPAAVDYANVIAKMLGLKLVHYFADFPKRVFPACSLDMTFAGPLDFLSLVKNASLVFTNSFHGTVFSIIFEKPFYTYTAKRKMLSRVLDLTQELGLEARRFGTHGDLNKLSLDVDFSKARQQITTRRKDAFNFLCDAFSQ